MKTTLRSYKRGYDVEERWQCPKCGRKQSFWGDWDAEVLEDECCNCREKVELQYRIMRGKKY